MKLFSIFRHEQTPELPPEAVKRRELVGQLREVRDDLQRNEQLYNMNADFDLVDYYIHERNALFVRYSHLIKQVRALDAAAAALSDASPAAAAISGEAVGAQ